MEDSGAAPEPVLEVPPPKEIQVLETADDIQSRRSEVLGHYSQFKDFARDKKHHLEEARQYQYFKRDADELEIWILEKLQTASEESYRDPTNLQVSTCCLLLCRMCSGQVCTNNGILVEDPKA